jgi:large subunit ribosomal protein L24
MPALQLIKTHVHAGDIVKVISGNHRGSEGKILQVDRAKHQVLIEGVRMIKKHVKRSQEQPNGAIIEREGPIHISNVKILTKKVEAAAEPKKAKVSKPAKEKASKEKASPAPKATKKPTAE